MPARKISMRKLKEMLRLTLQARMRHRPWPRAGRHVQFGDPTSSADSSFAFRAIVDFHSLFLPLFLPWIFRLGRVDLGTIGSLQASSPL